jgi:hypothetical protein
MSGDVIRHDGDELAQRIPLLDTFRGDVVSLATVIAGTLATNRFAEGAKDDATKYAEKTFQELMHTFGQIYDALGQAIGLQGTRLAIVKTIGDGTEGSAAGTAAGWTGSGGGPKG